MSNNDSLETMKRKLKSATKLKIQSERELCKILNMERTTNEELDITKAENELLKEQLVDLKIQISQTKHQISMIKICSTSEKVKIESHVNNLETHMKGFQDIFDSEREVQEHRMKEIKEQQEIEEEQLRLNELKKIEMIEQQDREIASVEAECEALERECAVLKKRNNAIMLKLRRKLLETENTRRKLMKLSEN